MFTLPVCVLDSRWSTDNLPTVPGGGDPRKRSYDGPIVAGVWLQALAVPLVWRHHDPTDRVQNQKKKNQWRIRKFSPGLVFGCRPHPSWKRWLDCFADHAVATASTDTRRLTDWFTNLLSSSLCANEDRPTDSQTYVDLDLDIDRLPYKKRPRDSWISSFWFLILTLVS